MLIDSHAHIVSEYYDNIDKVIEEAKNNNVLKIINCATSLHDIEEIIKVSNKYDINYALGIHPENADKFNENAMRQFEKYILNNIIAAAANINKKKRDKYVNPASII